MFITAGQNEFLLKLFKFAPDDGMGGGGSSGEEGDEGEEGNEDLAELENDPKVQKLLEKRLEEKVAGLKKNQARILDEKKKLQRQVEEIGDVDLEAYRNWQKEQAKAEEERKKKEGDFEAILKSKDEAYSKKEQGWREREKFLLTQLEENLVNSQLTEAIARHKGRPNLILHAIKPFVRVVEEDGKVFARVVDEHGQPRYTGEGGDQPMTPAQLVEEFKNKDEWARAFDATDAGGSGAAPGGSQNGSGSKFSQKVIKRSEFNKLPMGGKDGPFEKAQAQVKRGELKIIEG